MPRRVDLIGQLRSRLASMSTTDLRRAAQGYRQIASQLRRLAQSLEAALRFAQMVESPPAWVPYVAGLERHEYRVSDLASLAREARDDASTYSEMARLCDAELRSRARRAPARPAPVMRTIRPSPAQPVTRWQKPAPRGRLWYRRPGWRRRPYVR